ncbi:protein SAMBA [Lycium barbarum]|uniref:protein SAMBA n=1 Tax=Lycium ferocissimum TaxID=112874 RepID=UPI0028154FB8|nr:protein SAMBA [Lycium ferocissimum]XP_060207640.1 protein SAMBA [Lycium barbarum]
MSTGSSLTSSPARSSSSTMAMMGGNVGPTSSSSIAVDDFNFPTDLISIQDRKDEALNVLKSDLMASLNKEVKSLDEDSWMFEGPRSRIHRISRPGRLHKHGEMGKQNSKLVATLK